MNEMANYRPIEAITEEILFYKAQAGAAILEIGKRLNEAKAQLPHGEWLGWLQEKVDFSESTAQRFMRLAKEYENPSPVTDLGASKALVLLALPPLQRDEFLEENDAESMSKRELEKAVKEKLEAMEKAEAARKAQEAAEAIGYDMENPLIRMPKNLHEKHDIATGAYAAMQNAEKEKPFREGLLPKLEKQYNYEKDGYFIRVAKGVAEIKREGEILKHCVGGYAERHLVGKTTILFLRRADKPDRPLVTIEIMGQRIVQVHGFRNEREACEENPMKLPPEVLYKDFFDGWKDWVKRGSPRDEEGRPKERKQRKTGAERATA